MSTNNSLYGLSREGYEVVSSVRGHRVLADEPVELGGKDSGATPMELLLSSLAGCVCITMRMYADRKGWDLGQIEIELSFNDDKSTIYKQIRFSNSLTDEQFKRMMDISAKCPVSKLLSQGINIEFK